MQTRFALLLLLPLLALLALFAPLACDPTTTTPAPFPEAGSDDAGPPSITTEGDDASLLPPLDWDGGGDDDDEDATIALPPWSDDEDASPAPTGPPFDAGPDGECASTVGAGDLAIIEILIASVSGTGDHGEWLEIRSTRGCALDLRGLHGECAVGAKVATVDVDDDEWLPARGSLVLADSLDPAVNHALPGLVLSWAGGAGDVLRNEGGTVTLLAGGTIVDSVTYPTSKVPVGTSLAFPSDCPPSVRAEWDRWQPSNASWFPGFHGSPNTPNDDVTCPDD